VALSFHDGPLTLLFVLILTIRSASLLEPIGRHRSTHTTASKGKRNKKRKRSKRDSPEKLLLEPQSPSLPAVQNHVTVGLNSTTRYLESVLHTVATREPLASEAPDNDNPDKDFFLSHPDVLSQRNAELNEDNPHHLAAIFMTEATANYLPYTHLPTLAALASARHPATPAIRIVQLKASAEAKICEALGLPRAGIVGVLEDAPGAGPLVEYVRDFVNAVEVPWTREVADGKWLGTKILLAEERLEG
jgi:ribonuclease P/MRP protein subunit POP3